MTTTDTTYALIDADGHYGDYCTIWETYTDAAKARGGKLRGGRSVRLIEGCHRDKGDRVPRAAVADLLATGSWRVL